MNTFTTSDLQPIVSEYTDHEQVYSPVVGDFLDTNIVHLINFLVMKGVLTLHSCEGNPKKSPKSKGPKRGYIHFYNADNMQRALVLLHEVALKEKNKRLADFIMQENSFRIKKNGDIDFVRQNWDYEISWTTAHPWDRRDNPYNGYSLTTVLRIPHKHIVLLNEYLKPAEKEEENEEETTQVSVI